MTPILNVDKLHEGGFSEENMVNLSLPFTFIDNSGQRFIKTDF